MRGENQMDFHELHGVPHTRAVGPSQNCRPVTSGHSSDLKAIERDEAALAAMTPGPWSGDTIDKTTRVYTELEGGRVAKILFDADWGSDADAAGIARLRNRMPLYVAYFRAVEARDATPVDLAGAAERADELYAARKALLEDTGAT